MRYYDLTITAPGSTVPFRRWTSHPNGVFNPSAQNIEFDIPVAPFHAPTGAATISVQGVPLADLIQANSWGLVPPTPGNSQWSPGMNVVLKAGMQAGLPLANPNQAGVIMAGQIVQAFGNWEGTDMTLDMVIQASSYSIEQPGNLVLVWRAGMSLATALTNCLQTAFPTMPLQITLSQNLVLDYDVVHMAATLTDLATWLHQFTNARLLNPVLLAINGGTIFALDADYVAPVTKIAFSDLIGQPVWIAPGIMQAKFVMRADLGLSNIIRLPEGLESQPGLMVTRPKTYPDLLKQKSTFAGEFKVLELRHIGNLRAPDGASWATLANCAMLGIE